MKAVVLEKISSLFILVTDYPEDINTSISVPWNTSKLNYQEVAIVHYNKDIKREMIILQIALQKRLFFTRSSCFVHSTFEINLCIIFILMCKKCIFYDKELNPTY